MLVVSYYSDFAHEYALGLQACNTFPRLREFSLHWAGLAYDAFEIVRKMDEASWADFQAGKQKENRGVYAGDRWAKKYGAILMPELLLTVAAIAEQWGVPWGTAFLQCEKAGLIVRRGDVYVFEPPEKQKAGDS